MKNSDQRILVTQQKGSVVYLTLNRPAVLNALNEELLLALQRELTRIRDNPEVLAIVLTGSGDKAFSAGADIAFLNQATPLQVRALARLAVSVTHCIENLGKISIALINGFALGGGLELAESCMFRIAVTTAKFGHPEVRIGAVAGWGGTTRLPRLIGKGRAAEMLLTGKMVSGEEALQMGLIHRLVEPENLTTTGEQLLEEILQNSQKAVNLTWEALHRGLDFSIDESAKLGADYFGLVSTTQDFREGTEAFLQKRKPRYQGR